MLIWGFPFPLVCYIVLCACKWSANAEIPKFLSEGFSLPHTPPFSSIGLLCLLPKHNDMTMLHLCFYWLALQHILPDNLTGGTSLSN